MQRVGPVVVRRLAQGYPAPFPQGSHHVVPVPLLKHGEQRPVLRVPQADIAGSRGRSSQGGRPGRDLIPLADGDHPLVPADHGKRHGPVANGRNLHHLEDPHGQQRSDVPVHDSRAVLRSEHRAQQHGRESADQAFDTFTQAHHQVLLPLE